MSDNVMTPTTDASYIPTIISQKTLQRLGAYFQVAKNVSKSSDWTTATFGQVLNIPKTGAVVANTKTAGNNYTKQNPTATSTSVTLNQQKEVTFAIDDVTNVLDNQDTQARYAEDGAIALAEAVESAIFALHATLTNTVTWNRSSATTIDAGLLAIRKFFTDQKVPMLEQKYLVVDSTVYNDLLGQQKYTDMAWRAGGAAQDGPVASGAVMRVYGLEISESQLVPVTGSPVAYHNLAFSRNGFVLASRPLPSPKGFGGNYSIVNDPDIGISVRTLFWYNADMGCHQLTIDLLYGVAILDTRRVLEIESF